MKCLFALTLSLMSLATFSQNIPDPSRYTADSLIDFYRILKNKSAVVGTTDAGESCEVSSDVAEVTDPVLGKYLVAELVVKTKTSQAHFFAHNYKKPQLGYRHEMGSPAVISTSENPYWETNFATVNNVKGSEAYLVTLSNKYENFRQNPYGKVKVAARTASSIVSCVITRSKE